MTNSSNKLLNPVLSLKVLAFSLLLLCVSGITTMGATYSTHSNTNPGLKFEESATWVGNTIPGTYNNSHLFTVSNSSTLEINGIVYLNGSLLLENYSNIIINDNATLIISGDFNISDESLIRLKHSASLYVKGNITTLDKRLLKPSTYFYMDEFSNIAVEKNFNSTWGANACFEREGFGGNGNGNAPDLYIFGQLNGIAYTRIKGLNEAQDSTAFTDNEIDLVTIVSNASLLPIELSIFEVKGEQESLTFNWQTKTETNNDYFMLEYSINGEDWKELGREYGQGTTSEVTNYEVTFENNLPNVFVYFRLTQVDFDGNASFSKVIVLDNTTRNSKFRTLQYGPLNILYNAHEKRVIQK